MPVAPHNVQTSITLPRIMQAELQQCTKETGIPMAHIARVAFQDFLDKYQISKQKQQD